MSTIDEDVVFSQAGDDGEDTDLSVQPINYAGTSEFNDPAVLNRVFQNLRRRTEVLRGEVRDLKYLSDYDRGMLIWSDSTVQLVTSGSGCALVINNLLNLSPAQAPGIHSGGRTHGAQLFVGNSPYSGTLGTNDLSIVASSDTTGQRGYADGTSMADAGVLSVGSNNITFELAGEDRAGGGSSIRATVTGSPRRHIRVSYGTQAPGVTLAQLVTAINNDATLFGTEGSFGLRHMVRASTTSPGTTTTLPDVSRTKLKGGYDSEAYTVSQAQAAAFFGISENVLAVGDGLAIGFPAGLVESGSEAQVGGVWQYLGGRRQSLVDAPTDRVGGSTLNIGGASTYGNLFNTARQPELIPGSIPIGRMTEVGFVFIDGTTLAVDAPAIYISESFITVARIVSAISTLRSDLAATTGTTGASRVGYGGSDTWNSATEDDGTDTLALPAGPVEAALDAVVTQLSSITADSSGARRVGVETMTGSVRSGNESRSLSLPAGSVRAQIALLLNDANGVNGRVSENGHRLVSALPLYKDFSNADSVTASHGGVFLQSMLRAPANLAVGANGSREQHSVTLQPIVYDNGGDDTLTVNEAGSHFSADTLVFNGMNTARFDLFVAKLPVIIRGSERPAIVIAKITGATGASDAPDGLYRVWTYAGSGTNHITFRKLDGSTPSFTGMSGSAQVTFCNVLAVGNDTEHTRVHAFHYAPSTPMAVVGMADLDTPILETWTPEGTSGTLKGSLYADRLYFFTSTGSRSTDNILLGADAALLKGSEGSPVDATASHHHGATYSQFHGAWSAGLLSGTLDTLSGAHPGANVGVPAGSGWATDGILFNCIISISPSGPGSVAVTVLFSDGTDVVQAMVFGYSASSDSDTRSLRGTFTLPTYGGNLKIYALHTGPVLTNQTTVVIDQIAIWRHKV